MTALKEQGRRYAIVDAVSDAHLVAIGEAAEHHALITGGSGVAMGLPANFRARRAAAGTRRCRAHCPRCRGHAAVLAGSCSRATLGQIGYARASRRRRCSSIRSRSPMPRRWRRQRAAWMADKLGDTPIVIAASAPPDKVAALQQKLGRDGAGALIEQTLAHIAEDLVARGVRRLVVAGGETAGAVVSRLGVRSLRIGARDRSRRAMDLCRRRHHAAAAGVEVGQLRRARLLHQGFRGAAMRRRSDLADTQNMMAGSAMTIGGRACARNQT